MAPVWRCSILTRMRAARAAELERSILAARVISAPQSCRCDRGLFPHLAIDVLVNNAGRPVAAIADILVEDFDWVMETNVRGGFCSCSRAAHFRAGGKGNIIYVVDRRARGGGGFGSTHRSLHRRHRNG